MLKAYNKAKLGKRYKNEVLEFSRNLEENLINIQNLLIHKEYKTGKYNEFLMYEPKKRLIMALTFQDRVVHWAIYLVLEPIFSKGYIYDSYGCIKGKGVHSAVKRLQYWLRLDCKDEQQKYYYLKMDIAKYFYRIDHEILIEIIGNKISDKDVIWLLKKIINSEEKAFGIELNGNVSRMNTNLFDKGIPIGNLTSQLFANIYLNELDQYIKRELKIKRYVRYMDDMTILGSDKKELSRILEEVTTFLDENLRLDLNSKTAIRPVSLGVDFCGYKIWNTHIKLRKSTSLKMKRRLKKVQSEYADGKINFEKANATVCSYFGVLKHCDSYNLKSKIFKDFILKRQK